jgi:hypothetical protein
MKFATSLRKDFHIKSKGFKTSFLVDNKTCGNDDTINVRVIGIIISENDMVRYIHYDEFTKLGYNTLNFALIDKTMIGLIFPPFYLDYIFSGDNLISRRFRKPNQTDMKYYQYIKTKYNLKEDENDGFLHFDRFFEDSMIIEHSEDDLIELS